MILNHKPNWQIKSSEIVFSNQYLAIRKDIVIDPYGETFDYYTMTAEPLVAILAVNDKHQALLVKQFRVSLKQEIYGLPGGQVNSKEGFKVAAARELKEETGFRANSIESLSTMYLDPGRSEKRIHIFIAENLQKVSDKTDHEIEKYLWLDLDEAVMWVVKGKIKDPVAQYAILLYRQTFTQ